MVAARSALPRAASVSTGSSTREPTRSSAVRTTSAFRANPAQHFYAMHRALAERRRQQWRELCDLDENAVALAA